jgi:hypothetical protein
MDIFVEQIVKKKFGTKDYLIIAAVIIGALVLILASFLIPSITVLVMIGVIFGAYYLISARNVEFEYSVTNGDITIDKIINRRSRKRVISVDAHDIEDMGKFRPEIVKNKNGYTPYYTAQAESGENSWYFCAHTTKYGNVLVVFDPNERVLEAIKPFMPRQVAFVVFGRH